MTEQTSAPPVRRTGGRSARVRAAVLEATVEVLLEEGPDGLTVAAVAQRSGVHETSIYRRWHSIHELGLDAVLSRIGLEVPTPDTGSLEQDLLTLLHAAADFVATPLGGLLLRVAAHQCLDPQLRAARDGFWAARFAILDGVLRRAEERGELRPGVDRQAAAEMLIAPLHLRSLLTGAPIDDAYLGCVVSLLLAAVRRT